MSESKSPSQSSPIVPAIAVIALALVLGVSPGEVKRTLKRFGIGSESVAATPRSPSRPAKGPLTPRTVSTPRTPVSVRTPVAPKIPVSPPPTRNVTVTLPRAKASTAQGLLSELVALDAPYAVDIRPLEREDRTRGRLFADLPAGTSIHPSYEATYQLCRKYDPYNRSDRDVPARDVKAYLETLVSMAPLAEAFRLIPGSSVDDLQRVWFGEGRGFEHVFCGETGGIGSKGPKLGGYHFWYVHYRYEQEGLAWYLGADYGRNNRRGMADPKIVTGRFELDADGSGPKPAMSKQPKGGFSVGHSVASMLALGYISAKKNIRSPLKADLTGTSYRWTMYMDRKDVESLRTLWPMK